MSIYWILFLVALTVSAVGFKKFIYFTSKNNPGSAADILGAILTFSRRPLPTIPIKAL